MSYERKMLEDLAMPTRKEVEKALLRTLLKHGGVSKEFGIEQDIVDEIADDFGLNKRQRSAFLQTTYRKENRIKKSLLWHRLLFRAADSLAKLKLVSRPTDTFLLTKRRDWMLTEKGFDNALNFSGIPVTRKASLPVKSYEVQKIVNKMTESHLPASYNPIDATQKTTKTTQKINLRLRGFRQAVIEAYDFRCAVCRLRISSPDSLSWEVEAAHIVPHHLKGRDDIWNGLALCHLHHWAFDIGWFTLHDNYSVKISQKIDSLPVDCGIIGGYEFVRALSRERIRILLPDNDAILPHPNAIRWHRQNVFYHEKKTEI